MHFLVTGGSGFIGQALCRALLARNDNMVTTTSSHPAPSPHPRLRHLAADTRQPGSWQQTVAQADAIVNLAGRSIFGRWTRGTKQDIYDSRILTTRNLVTALPDRWLGVLLNASAVGYYGNRGDTPLTEEDGPGDDFLARLSRDWEMEAGLSAKKGARVVVTRFGIVLGQGGGALQQMLTAYRMFIGGPLGDGRQWFPWIHMEDLVSALQLILNDSTLDGPVNLCAPEPIRNRDLAAAIGKALGRPAHLRTPALALRLAMGEMADALLASQRVLPQRLLAMNFTFRYPDIASALANLLEKNFS